MKFIPPFITILALFCTSATNAAIQCYPYNDDTSNRSPFYSVSVFQNQAPKHSFVQLSEARTEGPGTQHLQGRTISWTNFSLTGTAFVEITLEDTHTETTEHTEVYPKSKHVEVEVLSDKKVRLFIPGPGQYVAEFGENGKSNPIIILASPWETNRPSETDPAVLKISETNASCWRSEISNHHTLYFSAGIYEFPEYTIPETVKRVYIEGGAIIHGAFQVNHDNVVIDGRGMISGQRMAHRQAHLIESPGKAKNLTVEGITLTDFPYFAIRILGSDSVIRWTNMVGAWIYNADGVVTWDRSTIRNSFIMANDDAIKLYDSHVSVSDCVIWNMTNGACMQLGWSSLEAHHVAVNNVDVIRAEWLPNSPAANNGIINLRLSKSGTNTQSHYVFNNIRSDTPVLRVIDLRMSGMGSKRPPNYHHLENFVFRNFDVQMQELGVDSNKNYILRYDTDYGFKDLKFENFKLNGKPITHENSATDGIFVIDDLSLPEVTFTKSE